MKGFTAIETIPAPNDNSEGYWVDFHASLRLVDSPADGTTTESIESSSQLTQVEWDLDLDVTIAFPGFIRRLPIGLIQYTGDQVLKLIVQQVSQRLMAKVQADFHATLESIPQHI